MHTMEIKGKIASEFHVQPRPEIRQFTTSGIVTGMCYISYSVGFITSANSWRDKGA